MADKSLALTRFLRFGGLEAAAHGKGWEEWVEDLLSRPKEELLKRAKLRRQALGWE